MLPICSAAAKVKWEEDGEFEDAGTWYKKNGAKSKLSVLKAIHGVWSPDGASSDDDADATDDSMVDDVVKKDLPKVNRSE